MVQEVCCTMMSSCHVCRFGTHGSLSVHQLESESEPLPAVTMTSPGPSRVLDIDRHTVIYIGGLGAHTQVTSLRWVYRCVSTGAKMKG